MKISTIIISFLIISIIVVAQDISGSWQGYLLQKSGGIENSYKFTAEMKHTKNSVTGTTRISLWNEPEIFGEIEFSGAFKNNSLFFKETKIIDENKGLKTFDWCIKTGTLKYKEKGDTAYLYGGWTAISPRTCSPGSIHLIKYNDSEKKNPPEDKPEEKIEDRFLKEGTLVIVPKEKITVLVSESAKEDGDTISLIYNDKVVLSEHRLTKEEVKIRVYVDKNKEKNKLILYAHNVGGIPPNTAKLQIKSGNLKQEIILKSDLNESDVIIFELE